jgi:hypothetical protein
MHMMSIFPPWSSPSNHKYFICSLTVMIRKQWSEGHDQKNITDLNFCESFAIIMWCQFCYGFHHCGHFQYHPEPHHEQPNARQQLFNKQYLCTTLSVETEEESQN